MWWRPSAPARQLTLTTCWNVRKLVGSYQPSLSIRSARFECCENQRFTQNYANERDFHSAGLHRRNDSHNSSIKSNNQLECRLFTCYHDDEQSEATFAHSSWPPATRNSSQTCWMETASEIDSRNAWWPLGHLTLRKQFIGGINRDTTRYFLK